MRYDIFFSLAKEAGIEEAELFIGNHDELEISLFQGEIDNYSFNSSTMILARGLIHGKFGSAACDVWSKEKAKYLVDEILKNAKVIENDDPNFIFAGSPRYKKVSTFNKELSQIPIREKMDKLYELEKKLRSYDEKITEVESAVYSEKSGTTTLINSKGLKLSQKNNYFVYYAGVVAKLGEQVKTNGDLFLSNDFKEFDVDSLVKKVATGALAQLGGDPCETGAYSAVLSPEVVSSFISYYVSCADAEEVQKNSSLFVGKLKEKVASTKVTIEDRPLDKSLFAKSFDDEGVATSNKAIIKNGILQTFLYNLTTAAKDGVESTGNADRGLGKMGVSPSYLVMKPGKKTQQELFEKIGNGVYITEVSGLHSGMNARSGNFSLQSTGFLVKDGKKDRPLDLITVSGNLKQLFEDISCVGNDVKEFTDGISCPSVIIKKIMISGT